MPQKLQELQKAPPRLPTPCRPCVFLHFLQFLQFLHLLLPDRGFQARSASDCCRDCNVPPLCRRNCRNCRKPPSPTYVASAMRLSALPAVPAVPAPSASGHKAALTGPTRAQPVQNLCVNQLGRLLEVVGQAREQAAPVGRAER